MASGEIFTRIQNEYEILRTRHAQEREERIRQAHKKAPRLEEIKRQMNLTGARASLAALKEPDKAERIAAELKRRMRLLEEERRRVIDENGIDPQYDKMHYDCRLCSDTGYTPDSKRCHCFNRRLVEALYSYSNLGGLLGRQNFDNFDLNMYSDTIKPDGRISVREYMKNVRDMCRRFCDNFDSEKRGFLFYGNSGLGKTFLSSCIAKELMDKGRTVVYAKATKLFSAYEDMRFGRIPSEDARPLTDSVYEAELLIIDDLGAESITKNTTAFLFDIINERAINGRKMIISTNHSPEELTGLYSYRFTSRMYEFFYPIHFIGDSSEDIRVKKMRE